jgi:hypothetical protein
MKVKIEKGLLQELFKEISLSLTKLGRRLSKIEKKL